MNTATPLTVTDHSFATAVLASETPVLVDFWAAWCGPCKMIAPSWKRSPQRKPEC